MFLQVPWLDHVTGIASPSANWFHVKCFHKHALGKIRAYVAISHVALLSALCFSLSISVKSKCHSSCMKKGSNGSLPPHLISHVGLHSHSGTTPQLWPTVAAGTSKMCWQTKATNNAGRGNSTSRWKETEGKCWVVLGHVFWETMGRVAAKTYSIEAKTIYVSHRDHQQVEINF